MVDREIHAKASGVEAKGLKQTSSLSFGPVHNVSGEGGAEDILPIDDGWEFIDYHSDTL